MIVHTLKRYSQYHNIRDEMYEILMCQQEYCLGVIIIALKHEIASEV